MGGRYVITEHTGKMQMPGADGKMTDTEFKGMSTEGYDNAKKKFVSTWIDNMGTGIMVSEGDYDAASKTLTYLGDYSPAPGVKTKTRQAIKFVDKDHRTMEMYEDRGGQEVKTMEISYTRKGVASSDTLAPPVSYFEIAGPDSAKLADFYRQVFQWEIRPGPFPRYFDIVGTQEKSRLGGIREEKQTERVLYVRVSDLKSALDRIVKEGGKVVIPPTHVSGVVDFALFEDPAGNRMGIIL
jgi:predicted enzyme related to lactoylglutathione lyase